MRLKGATQRRSGYVDVVPDRELADAMCKVVLERLEAEGLALNKVAKTISVPQPTLYQRLRGKGTIPIDDWNAIAAALGMTLNELIVAGRRRL